MNGTLPGVKKDLSANAILTDDIIVSTGVLDPNKDLVSGNDFIEWIPIGKSSSDDDGVSLSSSIIGCPPTSSVMTSSLLQEVNSIQAEIIK